MPGLVVLLEKARQLVVVAIAVQALYSLIDLAGAQGSLRKTGPREPNAPYKYLLKKPPPPPKKKMRNIYPYGTLIRAL